MMALSNNKVFAKKERKDQSCVFEVERFQTPAILLQVLTLPVLLAALNNIWLSLYKSKMNMFVGDVCMCVGGLGWSNRRGKLFHS